MKPENSPVIGFFPLFFNLSETGRAVLIAKRYQELGGKAVFFSHGGEYDQFVKNSRFDVIKMEPFFIADFYTRYFRIARGEQKGDLYIDSFLREAVDNEVKALKESEIQLLVSTNNELAAVSARIAKIPLIAVTTAPGMCHYAIPEMYENKFTRLFPQWIKIKVFNWIMNNTKTHLKPFNALLKKHNVKLLKSSLDLYYGDITLATNFLEFIDVFPHQRQFPAKNYVGIILLEELFQNSFLQNQNEVMNQKIENHLKGSEKHILLSMGSSGDKTLFLKILRELDTMPYKVIAVYANILQEDELPNLGENIMLTKYVPSIAQLHRMVDLSIIHGGQGTVYAAAYSGKPIIGYPMQFEQHLNLEKMVGHGAGLMLSKRYFEGAKLTESIKYIFDDYSHFLGNAQLLSKRLPQPEGDQKAAERIIEIVLNQKNIFG